MGRFRPQVEGHTFCWQHMDDIPSRKLARNEVETTNTEMMNIIQEAYVRVSTYHIPVQIYAKENTTRRVLLIDQYVRVAVRGGSSQVHEYVFSRP